MAIRLRNALALLAAGMAPRNCPARYAGYLKLLDEAIQREQAAAPG